MRHFVKTAALAAAILAIAGCNRGAETSNAAVNEVVDNQSLAEPGNDASAVEAATNAPETMPPPAEVNAADAPDTSGGDTGGNSNPNVESNVDGM